MKATLAWIPFAFALAACSCSAEDPPHTVRSRQSATCESNVTTDATERAALSAFDKDVKSRYFVSHHGSLFVSNREESPAASGLREYQGPFHLYLHPRDIEPEEARQGVEWAGTAYLHATRVRTRANGGEWSDWEPVRTGNFSASEGERWKCLVGAEIAAADVRLREGSWQIAPVAVSVYDADELQRLLPTPSTAQIEGEKPVVPLSLSDRTSA